MAFCKIRLCFVKVPDDGPGLHKGLKEYFHYYNNELCHHGISNQIPVNRYFKRAAL